jgi:hypothetical protein
MREKPTNTPVIHSVYLIIYGSFYMFRHYIAIFRERSYWEMLNWGAVDRIFWTSMLFPVTWCLHHATRNNTPIHNILSTAPQLSISQKALGTFPEDGNIMPKHVGATIHN